MFAAALILRLASQTHGPLIVLVHCIASVLVHFALEIATWLLILLQGPAGNGVMDLYTPEISCVCADPVTGIPDTRIIDGSGVDITKNLTTVRNYDELHVQALINQINGKQSSGRYAQTTPNLFGMNMQSISVGQKVISQSFFAFLVCSTGISRRALPC